MYVQISNIKSVAEGLATICEFETNLVSCYDLFISGAGDLYPEYPSLQRLEAENLKAGKVPKNIYHLPLLISIFNDIRKSAIDTKPHEMVFPKMAGVWIDIGSIYTQQRILRRLEGVASMAKDLQAGKIVMYNEKKMNESALQSRAELLCDALMETKGGKTLAVSWCISHQKYIIMPSSVVLAKATLDKERRQTFKAASVRDHKLKNKGL